MPSALPPPDPSSLCAPQVSASSTWGMMIATLLLGVGFAWLVAWGWNVSVRPGGASAVAATGLAVVLVEGVLGYAGLVAWRHAGVKLGETGVAHGILRPRFWPWRECRFSGAASGVRITRGAASLTLNPQLFQRPDDLFPFLKAIEARGRDQTSRSAQGPRPAPEARP